LTKQKPAVRLIVSEAIMKTWFTAILIFSAAAPLAAAGDANTDLNGNCGSIRQISIYGKDNREEYCSQNAIIRQLADSVAGLFTDHKKVTLSGQPYVYGTTTDGENWNLAPGQRFADQPAPAYCTGFLVGSDLLVTAGHCVMDHVKGKKNAPRDHVRAGCQENPHHPDDPDRDMGEYCENIRVVFGFRKELGGYIPRSAPPGNVYKCVKVLAHSLNSGPDYTLIKLDRPVAGRAPLAIDRNNSGLAKNVSLFVIGHPDGLPLKIAGDAKVLLSGQDLSVNDSLGLPTKWVDKGYSFLSNLDSFHGNSGSPVFDLNTLMVEGILVSGDKDYTTGEDGLNRANTYPQNAGATDIGKGVGEVSTKISVPAASIPATDREREMIEMNRKAGGRLYQILLQRLIQNAGQQQQAQPHAIPIPNYVPPGKPDRDVQWI
jgi:hypothetical protein